jgi:outer membrane protein assembly factor BamB
MDHNIYAFTHSFNAASLELAKDGSKTLRNDFDWKVDLGMAIVADPVLEDNVIYAATIEGKLFAIDANSGKIIWSFDDGGNLGSVWGSPVIDESIIFLADMNGNVYTVDKATGKQIWPSPFSAGGKIVGGGVLTSDGVVFATGEGKLFLISQEKEPKTIASYDEAIYSSVQVNGENIIIAPASEAGLLLAIGVEGFEVWSFIPSEN